PPLRCLQTFWHAVAREPERCALGLLVTMSLLSRSGPIVLSPFQRFFSHTPTYPCVFFLRAKSTKGVVRDKSDIVTQPQGVSPPRGWPPPGWRFHLLCRGPKPLTPGPRPAPAAPAPPGRAVVLAQLRDGEVAEVGGRALGGEPLPLQCGQDGGHVRRP